MFCSECGAAVTDGANFCGNCGAPQIVQYATIVSKTKDSIKSETTNPSEQSKYSPKTRATVLLLIISAAIAGGVYKFNRKTDEWHVGYCAAGTLSESPQLFSNDFYESTIEKASKTKGINAQIVLEGFRAFKKGGDYTESCKLARQFENELHQR